MKVISTILAVSMTFVSLPALAVPGLASTQDQTRTTTLSKRGSSRLNIPSPLDSPLGRLLAQNDEGSANAVRIREIDQEINALSEERSQIRVTGPVIATAIGLGLLLGGGGGALLIDAACDDAKDDPNEDCNESAKDDLTLAFGIVAGIGGVLTIFGGSTWGSRASKRRAIDRKQLDLRDERRQLHDSVASLRLGSEARHGSRYVTLGFDF